MRRWLLVISIFLFLAGGVFSMRYSPASKVTTNKTQNNKATSSSGSVAGNPSAQKLDNLSEGVLVTRVVDGDTIEIEGGLKVRYIGINTPETVDPRTTVQCFGKEASNKNKELVEGKKVRLEKDVSETDKYGRLLRYVYLPDDKAGASDIFVNEYLVKEGFAYSSAYPPDIKYQSLFNSAQTFARENNKGLWGSCGSGAVNSATTVSGCLIKGNISSSGEKIYHVPGQKYYNQTVIDETKGEKWFCSEDEAQKMGWRKAKL